MSHFTKVQTQINDLVALKKALDQLGWKYRVAEEGQEVVVRGYKGQTTTAELCVDMGKYDIGVVKNAEGSYELVSDWWGIETTKGLTEQEIVKELNQKYAYQKVVMAVEEAGYTVDTNNVAADGTVKLNVSKWG
jgi:Protein of unknown function (DUF1257)